MKMAQCRTKNVGNNFARKTGVTDPLKEKQKITRIVLKDAARTAQ